MNFPYLRLAPNVYAPIVPLEIWNHGRWIGQEGYVDSGATLSIFGEEVARLLGIRIEKGKRLSVRVGDGKEIPVYEHHLRVRFAGIIFNTPIGFSRQLGVGFNLIGRKGFFEKFRVCFNDRDKVVQTTALH